jgi:hypothetical protein
MAMITYRKDKGAAIKVLDDWRIAMCPMSSVSLMPVAQTLRAAWENDGQIVTGFMDSPVAFQKVGPKNAKHPALAQNAKGQTVIVSVLGAGWAKAGHLHWDVLDKKGNVSSSEAAGLELCCRLCPHGRAFRYPALIWRFTSASTVSYRCARTGRCY